MGDATELVQRQVDAANARDAPAFAACYAEDAAVLNADGSVMVSGRSGIEEFYAQMFRTSPHFRVEVPTRIAVGDWVIDEESVSGIVLEGFPSHMSAAIVYRVSEGLIAQAQLLF
jgi:uncharacterized protein (TIGR02246 family)